LDWAYTNGGASGTVNVTLNHPNIVAGNTYEARLYANDGYTLIARTPPFTVVANTGQSTPAALYYVHNDHLGTPQALTNEIGVVVWKATYDPFGQATVTTGTITNNLRLAGQYFDSETGLHYNWHRYYDPRIGRYISSDPMSVVAHVRKSMTALRKGPSDTPPLETNSYLYVSANPLRWIDPTGLETLMCSNFWHPHTFLCVDGTCSGKYPSGNPIVSPGEIRDDAPNQPKASCAPVPVPKGCDGGAFDQCVVTRLLQRGPSGDMYNWSGQNCGTWAEEVITSCRNACTQPSTPGAQ
jgi:RHS repeat-associated protein